METASRLAGLLRMTVLAVSEGAPIRVEKRRAMRVSTGTSVAPAVGREASSSGPAEEGAGGGEATVVN
jgi:hypothetical protein